ncbi:MAG: hypothetical protein ABIG55_04895 [Candidatus Omnitrophota bacterium]|nr:hypothetical protein [Candidatus Omnitrophota bacterium]
MNKKPIKIPSPVKKVLPIVLVAALIAAGVVIKMISAPERDITFQKGIGYVTWSQAGYDNIASDESIVRARETGADWISILVTWYQTTPWTGDIHKTDKTPSDESVLRAVRKAHELGMKVTLKLHLDLLDKSDGSWRGEIGATNEADWEKWFKGYTEYVLYYANIANDEKIEMICIGTELSTAASVKGYLWRDMISKIKSRYKGLTTYAAHWDRYQDIRFWDMLDFVGINPYFPLTEEMAPSLEALKESWVPRVNEMEAFQTEINKPIIFPEIGCSSADGGAIRPWEHVPRTEVNLQLQEDYYRALLETFWQKDWFYGLYWWYWGTNANMGGQYNRGFTPQNKPAEIVVKEWFSKPVKRARY